MAALGVAKLAAQVLLFATLVVGEAPKKLECDVQAISTCYWGIADRYGTNPLAKPVPDDKKDYVQNLCIDVQAEQDFPEEPGCKKDYASCSDAEKKKFAQMEGGYTALRNAISTANKCESVALLRDCLNLEVIRKCDLSPAGGATFEETAKATLRGNENLKKCLEEAVKPCEGKQNAPAIAQLNKIGAAIVDLGSFSDGRNAASRTNAAVAVIVPFLLSFLVRGIY